MIDVTRHTPVESTRNAKSFAGNVTVILSTFNGSAFLQEQLNSLYAQTHPNIKILARDDGSTDTTRHILERAQADGRITVLADHENLGAAASFFRLLQAAATGADYVAFCDQDDVWLPEKISRAIAALATIRNGRAAAYYSRLDIVDATLTPIRSTALPVKIGFGNALVENICVGCTMVLNRHAIDLVCENLPANVLIHDWWCYLVLSCFGEIVFDRDAHIKYRQHGENVFGAAAGTMDRLTRNVRRFATGGNGRDWQSEQAKEFLLTFGDRIPVDQLRVLRLFVEAKSAFWRRVGLALSNDIWRQRRVDDLLWRLLILMNRY